MKNLFKIELNPNRIYGLDILRALAILFVVTGHGENIMPQNRYKYISMFVFDGVSIFFVLSGFLIGGILLKLLKENTINTKLLISFWLRRWLRTVPNYFLILIIIIVLNYLFTDNFSFNTYKLFFIFSQNLFSNHPDFFFEAWSLSVEEWFYLLVPVIIFICIKCFKISIEKSVLFTVILVILSVTFFRYIRYSSSTINDIIIWDSTLRKQVFTRLDSLMYGVLGAYIYYRFQNFWNSSKVYLFFIGIAIFVIIQFNLFKFEQFGLYGCVFSFSIASIATLLLLPYLSTLKSGKGMIYKFITYISLISYSMYLTNLTIVQIWILDNIEWSYLNNINGYLFLVTRYFTYWLLTISISILLYKYFEIPIMKLRDRISIK